MQDDIQQSQDRGPLRIPLPRAIDWELSAEIEKESAYLSSQVRRLRVTDSGTAVEVELEGSSDPDRAKLDAKIKRYLAAMLARVRTFEPIVYLESRRRNEGPVSRGVFSALVERGWLCEHGPGFVSLAGPARRLAVALDRTLASRYQDWFGAEEAAYPALIRSDVLSRCGYFSSHPNAARLVTHLVDDFDEIEAFRQINEGQDRLQLPGPAALAQPDLCLNPAACFPCYQALQGGRIPPTGRTLTWQGRVFRYESRNTSGLERLGEFSVRELVFLGGEQRVRDQRERLLSCLREVLTEWDLDCRIETASDPFFATVSAARTFWQHSRQAKYEMRIEVDPGDSPERRHIAGGSINLHDQFFGTRFGITAADGQPATTACAGVGIERWVLAVFSQHGLDPARWPEALRAAVTP
jgi:seryl-tRNA synthetase